MVEWELEEGVLGWEWGEDDAIRTTGWFDKNGKGMTELEGEEDYRKAMERG